MKRALIVAAILLVLAGSALGAGSAGTCDAGVFQGPQHFGMIKHTCTFTSDDTTGAIPNTTVVLGGYLTRVTTDPGTLTDLYDIVLNGPLGADIMGGALANRSTTSTQNAYPLAPDGTTIVTPPVYGTYTFVFTNNTATSQTLTIEVYVQR